MPKVTGFNRKRIGHRNYLATIQNPPTTQDEYGQISYSSGSWTTAVTDWPCELIDTSGGEIIDGMMTKSSTEKVAVGDKPQIDAATVTAQSRCIIDGMMTKSSTEKVAVGDKPQIDAATVTSASRCIIDGKTYGITAVRDVSGDNFTVRLELRSTK